MINTIKCHFSELTKSEKVIADYFVNNPEKVLNMSIYEIAEENKTSVATVTRFSKKVFKCSFADAKIKIAKSIPTEDKQMYNFEWSLDFKEFPSNLYSRLTVCLENVMNSNDEQKYRKAVDAIAKADTVYVYGIGNSGAVAQDLVLKLFKIRKKVIYFSESKHSVINALMTTDKDVVIAISNSGNTREVVLPVQRAKENGTKVVAITSNSKSKLAKSIDENDVLLLSPHDERDNLHRLGSVLSRYGQLFLVDILFIGVAQTLYEDPIKIIDEYREILKKVYF